MSISQQFQRAHARVRFSGACRCLASGLIGGLAVAALAPEALAASDAQKPVKHTAAPAHKPTPKTPDAAPATMVEAAPAIAPAAPTALGGAWKISWLRQNKSTAMTISGEKPQPGLVGFDGALVSLDGMECKGGGFAAKTLGGVFPLGGDVNMVGVADYVRVVTQCGTSQVWLEALGVAGTPLQWVGRAVMIDAKGDREFESFVMTR